MYIIYIFAKLSTSFCMTTLIHIKFTALFIFLYRMAANLFEELRDAIIRDKLDKVISCLPSPGEECAEVLREVDSEGKTLLHLAVQYGGREIIKELLSAAMAVQDLEEEMKWKKDNNGVTPVLLAVKSCLQTQNTELFSLFFPRPDTERDGVCSRPFSPITHNDQNVLQEAMAGIQVNKEVAMAMVRVILDHSQGNPVHLYDEFQNFFDISIPNTTLEDTVSLVVLGDSGSGKSSLIKSLQVEGFTPWIRHAFFNVRGVDTHTAGIIPTHFDSVWFGKVIFYDLSSHREFVHEAILKCGHLSNAVFLIVVNLTESITEIAQQIVYWLSFVRYHHSKVVNEGAAPPNVVIVGSHLHDIKLGRLANRERFRDYAYPRGMRHIDVGNFHISNKILMDCRKTSPENAMLRYTLKSLFGRIRDTRLPIPSKSYILYAVIEEMCRMRSVDEVQEAASVDQHRSKNAITLGDLLQELRTEKHHCKVFYGTIDEIITLCEPLVKLNLLLLLRNKEDESKSWLVPDSYPFLCEIEEAIFHSPDQNDLQSSQHGIYKHTEIIELFQHRPQPYNIDLLLKLMIHYVYCEVVPIGNEVGYFFPHLLDDHLDVPEWENEEDRFMFAWSLAPESHYHHFMPHLVHHFLLQLSQETELNIQTFDRATRTLAWSNEEKGVEVLVHIHASQKLFVSIRCIPNKQLNCLHVRKMVIRKIKEILKSQLSYNMPFIESILPCQKHLHLPLHTEPFDKLQQYKTETIKEVIINKRESIAPMEHSQPLVLIDELLFFEPYYYMDQNLRQTLLHPVNPNDNIEWQYFLDLGNCLQLEKLCLLLELIDIDIIFIHSNPTQPFIDTISQAFTHVSGRGLTYSELRHKLDSISFFEIEEIMEDVNQPLEDNI